MNGRVVQGWQADPFGIHEARYFSATGEPTNLVRDRGVESYDAPPSGGYPPQDTQTYGPGPGYPTSPGPGYPSNPLPGYPGSASGGYGTPGSGPQGAGPSSGPGPYGGPGPSGPGFYGRPQAPKPGLVPLRPLTRGEILDGAFTAMRWNPKTILSSSAAVAVISAVLIALVSYSAERWALSHTLVPVGSTSASTSQVNLAGVGAVAAIGGVTTVVLAVANLFLTGLLTVAVSQGVLGIKETLGGAWRTLRPRIWRLIAMLLLLTLFLVGGWALGTTLSVLVGVLIGAGAHQTGAGVLVGVLGSLTVSVFAVIALVRWSVAIPVVILERSGPLKSLGRSWRLVKRSSWRVFSMLLLTEIIVVIANEVINVPFSVASGGFSVLNAHTQQVNVGGLVVTAIGQIIAYSVTAPLLAGAIVLVYTDLRMRREGLDLTLQAAAAGTPAGGRPDSPADSRPDSPADSRPDGASAAPW